MPHLHNPQQHLSITSILQNYFQKATHLTNIQYSPITKKYIWHCSCATFLDVVCNLILILS